MNNSLELYDLAPAEDPAPAVEQTVVSTAVADSDPNTVGIGQEMQGKEGGGVKKSEVRVFLADLEKEQGVIVVGDKGRSMGLRFGLQLEKPALKIRQRLSDCLYMGAVIPDIVSRLDDGRYNAARLGNIIKRRAGRGKA